MSINHCSSPLAAERQEHIYKEGQRLIVRYLPYSPKLPISCSEFNQFHSSSASWCCSEKENAIFFTASGFLRDFVPLPDLLPMFLHLLGGKPALCEICLHYQANVSERLALPSATQKLLCFAASLGHAECVANILRLGKNLDWGWMNKPSELGELALCIAVTGEFPAVVQVLLEGGADLHQAGMEGTPLQMARRGGERLAPLATFLVAAGATK